MAEPIESPLQVDNSRFERTRDGRLWPLPPSWNEVANYIDVHPDAVIDASASIRVMIPPDKPRVMLRIGPDTHVFGHFAFQRPDATLEIGARCHIGSSHFTCSHDMELGDDVIVSWGCTFVDTSNHSLDWSDRRQDAIAFRNEYLTSGGAPAGRNHSWSGVELSKVVIASKAWISFGCSILAGARVGEGSVIGAGSIVTSEIGAWKVAAGNPCRVIRSLH